MLGRILSQNGGSYGEQVTGSTEFGYSKTLVKENKDGLSTAYNNRHTLAAQTDWELSLDLLEGSCPNCKRISLVVAWFGDDLRAEHCTIAPRVEALKTTSPIEWRVAGLSRGQARLVSYVDGKPAYGGTPSDSVIVEAIQDLKARGFEVMLYPFIMMDIPEGNGLPDPYGGAEQQRYPWRGRITCHPASGQPGTPDKTLIGGYQVVYFMGFADPLDFGWDGESVTYSGDDEWRYSRFILHLAKLAQVAGGVDAFMIGTEMPGLSSVRTTGNFFMFASLMAFLAGQVRSMLGADTKISYAADWSEYHSYRPNDGSGDVLFHLDLLWADENIDFIGIDNYLPLSDWRDGQGHADHAPGAQSIHDVNYLKSGIEGGEYFDYYYASAADRESQIRSPIEDLGHGEDWIFRQKDLRGWWESAHHNRPGGIRSNDASEWQPKSKPIWFTEYGCPAIDKGTNQPNVFYDPKSSESEVPYFSSGVRDDLIQRRYLRATQEYWAQEAGNNPISPVYGGPMVDPVNMYAWAWDVRPFPSYPIESDTWADWGNFTTGHWLSGRLGGVSADGLARLLMQRCGLVEGEDFDCAGADGVGDGFLISSVTSARSVLETLGAAFFFDAVESGGRVEFRSRRSLYPLKQINAQSMIDQGKDKERVAIVRAQETELPAVVRVTGYDSSNDFNTVTAQALIDAASSERVVITDLPLVTNYERLQGISEGLLQEAWASRERFTFTLAPTELQIEAGDLLELELSGGTYSARVTGVKDGEARAVEAALYDAPVYEGTQGAQRAFVSQGEYLQVAPLAVFIDGPLLRDQDTPWQGYLTGYQLPFSPGMAFLSSPITSGYELRAAIDQTGILGELVADLPAGPLYRWDMGNLIKVKLYSGELASLEDSLVFAGGNALLIEGINGEWEVVQFAQADLVGARSYSLSKILRGQRGSELAMGAATGARVVVLDGGIVQNGLSRSELGLPLNWQAGRAGAGVGSQDYTSYLQTFTGKGERPLSPVHLSSTRAGDDSILIGWVRRTRTGGDSWEAEQVPLGEEAEHYEIEIRDGEAVKRVLSSTSQSITYSAAMQVEDFGALASSFEIQVFQLSAAYGRGVPSLFFFDDN
ncbi:hypothetical protein PsAD2_04269 [Pseudovibrio axinellae]|uniref:GTA TIM-barrel-like domain protein n=2 Tax=Pseudovibrio axinellae TaxID=989403 RepID=A0A161X8Z4_9HYPH|nr:hypothetical protein PsAD2_04269 [Pseudovibrio axinellae]